MKMFICFKGGSKGSTFLLTLTVVWHGETYSTKIYSITPIRLCDFACHWAVPVGDIFNKKNKNKYTIGMAWSVFTSLFCVISASNEAFSADRNLLKVFRCYSVI